MEEAARISTSLMAPEAKLKALQALAEKYPEDANVHFLVAEECFRQGSWALFDDYAERAYTLAPSVAEYQLYAGLAAFQEGDIEKTIRYLEGVDDPEMEENPLPPDQELYRLTVLSKAWAGKEAGKAAACEAKIQAILEAYGAEDYYQEAILSKLEALSAWLAMPDGLRGKPAVFLS